ncbi:DUF1992 domain-containing protein [Yoonia sp. R2331]|uniref:DnaJ family domain-containing protein n=1 Tax=Yoonia sp. R2331 TaxID=3237238 RepID=UPI0034E43530
MTHPLEDLINKMMAGAAARGDFDNLPGAGKPLDLSGDPKNPLLNRMMTEAQAKPPAITLKEQIAKAQAHLKTLTDPAARKAQMKVIADLQTRLAIEVEAMRRYG